MLLLERLAHPEYSPVSSQLDRALRWGVLYDQNQWRERAAFVSLCSCESRHHETSCCPNTSLHKSLCHTWCDRPHFSSWIISYRFASPWRKARYHCNSVINLLLCDVNIHEVVASVLGFSPGISLYLFNTHSHIGYLKMSKEAVNQSRM